MKLSVPKWLWIASSALLAVALIPSLELRMSFWSVLSLPFRWLYAPPLVYSDKPWFLTYLGGVVTAAAWSLCLLAIAFVVSLSRPKNEKNSFRFEMRQK